MHQLSASVVEFTLHFDSPSYLKYQYVKRECTAERMQSTMNSGSHYAAAVV